MSKREYGLIFKMTRFFLKLIIPQYEVEPLPVELEGEPVVFVSHHQNMQGPIPIMVYMTHDVKIRLWAFGVFFDREQTYKHYVNFTFTKRFGWPEWLAKLVAKPSSIFVEKLAYSILGIPVYRKSRKIMKTFEMTNEALKAGEAVLVFPDVNYTSSSEKVGEIYEGFLNVERRFYTNTGVHVNFVPLYADTQEKLIKHSAPLQFDENIPFMEQREEMANKIRKALNELSQI